VAEQPTFLSGKLLLAMPGMADPRFERAVIANKVPLAPLT
jgi:putative transcriptional regulator